jgi:aminoglycoside phosphotransferase (APT) family kinase protein
MVNSDAKLMRAIGDELIGRIAPELQTPDARERVAFMRWVLGDLATNLDIVPDVARGFAPLLRKALEDVLAILPNDFPTADYRRALGEIPPQQGDALTQEITGLRIVSARLARALADCGAVANSEKAIALLGAADREWLRRVERASSGKLSGASVDTKAAATPRELVAPESMSAYLRAKFPASKMHVKSVAPVPGGRSKRTLFIALSSDGSLPADLVMRQDMYAEKRGTTVRDEYRPLELLAGLSLPVPKPVHFEPEVTALGAPFMLVERLAGQVPGNYFGMDFSCPDAFHDLARLLAKLHQIKPDDAGVAATAASSSGRLGAQVEEFWSLWRKNSLNASPVIESAYAWARAQCANIKSTETLVHGDCGPHNLLVQDGTLAGLLDWEFLHVGDPAEDLGIARVYAETMMPWDEFMRTYREAGAADVSDARINVGVLNHYLKGTTLVAASGRNFAEGHTSDFIKGANAYTGLRKIEMKIVEFMDRVA